MLLCVLLLVAVARASVALPSEWASSWDVKLVGGPPELADFEIALWVNGDSMLQKVAFANNTREVSYPDFLVVGPPNQRSCFQFSEANFTCEVQCLNVTQCGHSCASCNAFVPLFSEFDDPQTVSTPGCGGVPTAVLYNVTVLHTITSVLCYDPAQQKPLFYRRSSDDYSFTASVIAFTTVTSPSDFVVPSYCSCNVTATALKEEQRTALFSLFLAK
jgi:hypothetical protein